MVKQLLINKKINKKFLVKTMTTKNLKIFHELNRLDTAEKKAAREKAILDKQAKADADKIIEDAGHRRIIITTNPRKPRVVEKPAPKKKKVVKKKATTPKPEPSKEVEELKKVVNLLIKDNTRLSDEIEKLKVTEEIIEELIEEAESEEIEKETEEKDFRNIR